MPTDDEAVLLAERVGALQGEVKQLKRDKEALKDKLRYRRQRAYFSDILDNATTYAIVATIVVAAGWGLYKYSTVPAAATHCYIKGGARTLDQDKEGCVERVEEFFVLTRALPWRFDKPVGEFETLEKAVEAAQRIECPLQ